MGGKDTWVWRAGGVGWRGGGRGWRGAISLVPDQDVDEHGGDLAHLRRVGLE